MTSNADLTTTSQVVARAQQAQAEFASASQGEVDQAVRAVAWSLYEPGRAKELAELAVADTGLGNVADKIIKNQRKTFGTLRDLLRRTSVGIISDEPERGLTIYAKPVGVVGAITPSTNPAATPINKAMMAIKGANAIVIAPSPAGWSTTAKAVEYARAELGKIGAPADLIQVLPSPVSREATYELMELVDLVVTTGSQNNVRASYRSGTPAIGVGAGNVPVIIDTTADLADAAEKIAVSKTFDNATSCSSENSLVILDDIYDHALEALTNAGAFVVGASEAPGVTEKLFPEGHLNRDLIAQDAAVLIEAFGLDAPADTRYLIVEESAPSADRPLTGEKLSLVLTVYRAVDFDDAVAIVGAVLDVQGKGHSVGIHTANEAQPKRLAEELPVVRVLVNQAHTFGNGGSFENALPFTLSMGCGTWAGNSISENLSLDQFLNLTHLVRTMAEDLPTEEDLFGPLGVLR